MWQVSIIFLLGGGNPSIYMHCYDEVDGKLQQNDLSAPNLKVGSETKLPTSQMFFCSPHTLI